MKYKRRYHDKPIMNVGRLARSVLPALVAWLVLAGCAAVGPDYRPVEPNAPEKWHSELAGGLTEGELSPGTLARWWTTLDDPVLTSLEARAVKGNLDLKGARARVREARALRAMARSGLFPTLDTTASASYYRTNRFSDFGPQGFESSLYSAGFDAGWELDIFGGTRRAIEAARADLEATREDLHDVLVSLLAEVALNYVEVRTCQARLAATEANAKAQERVYELNLSQYRAGIVNELAVKQSLSQLEHTRSLIPALETGLSAAKNRLAVLLGQEPGSLDQELADTRPIPVPPLKVAVGVPAETLRHRPDIRRAERNLAAATARIGVAKAELYPKLRLPGTIGLESIKSGDLLKWISRTWSYGPALSWRIFDAGAIRQNIKVQTARQEQSLIQYEAAVLRAKEEVENSLVAYAKELRRRESLKAAAAAARKTYKLARDQYNAGLADFITVLDAQGSLLSFQDELAQSKGAVVSNLVRLYKALGGGWENLEPARDELAQSDE